MGQSDYSNIPNFSGDTNPYMPCLDSKGNYKPETPDQTKLFNALYPSSKANYMHVVPNSHFWTDLKQIIASIDYQLQRMRDEAKENSNAVYCSEPLTREYLLVGLNNCIKNGYKIKRFAEPHGGFSSPVFASVDAIIKYVTDTSFISRTDFIGFSMILENTLNNGLNLTNGMKMQRTEVYKRLDGERDYQDDKWGTCKTTDGTPDEEKSVAEWISYMEFHLAKAKEKVYYLKTEEALAEVRKVTALGVRAMEIHGCPEREREGIFNPLTLKVGKPNCDDNCDCKKE